MLVILSAPGEAKPFLPVAFGHPDVMAEGDATSGVEVYTPGHSSGGSHIAVFVHSLPATQGNVTDPAVPESSRTPLEHAVHSLLARLDKNRWRSLVADRDVDLRLSVRHLDGLRDFPYRRSLVLTGGAHVTLTPVPFSNLPVYWGETGLGEAVVDLSANDRTVDKVLREVLDALTGLRARTGPGAETRTETETETGTRPVLADDRTGHPRLGLAGDRIRRVLAELAGSGARSVLDIGCGRGDLLSLLAHCGAFDAVCGIDIRGSELAIARARLQREWLPPGRRALVTVHRRSVLDVGDLGVTADAVLLMEVLEHLSDVRLRMAERAVFQDLGAPLVIVTTPNLEHTRKFPGAHGPLRHPGHRFEFSRAQFGIWAGAVAASSGYAVRLSQVGTPDPQVGGPTLFAAFTRTGPPGRGHGKLPRLP